MEGLLKDYCLGMVHKEYKTFQRDFVLDFTRVCVVG